MLSQSDLFCAALLPPTPQDNITVQELRGLFLELDPLDTGCVPYTRLQQEMEVRQLVTSLAAHGCSLLPFASLRMLRTCGQSA